MNKKLLISVLLLFFVFSLGALAKGKEEASSLQKWDMKDLDATHIRLEDIKLLDEFYSRYTSTSFPRWSPDGKKILYAGSPKDPSGANYIYMRILGRSDEYQSLRVPFGHDVAWSPDGKRIAYQGNKKIVIYDIFEKKEYVISTTAPFSLSDWDRPKPGSGYHLTQWSKDGKKISFFSVYELGPQTVHTINLDDLKWGTDKIDYQKTYVKFHPNFEIRRKKKESGYWAINKINPRFAIRLLDSRYEYAELSPDLTKLAFVKIETIYGVPKHYIYVAKIGKSPSSHIRHYEIPLGMIHGVKKEDILDVREAKINPLNNKIIGYKGGKKGEVLVESSGENKAVVRTYLLPEDFGQNPVAVKNESYGPLKEIFKEKNKEVEVMTRIIGKPKEGLLIEKIEVIPPRIMIKGPENLIKNYEYVTTSPIDISFWTKSGEVEKDIILPHPYVKIVSLETKAKIRITIVVPLRAVGEIKPPKLLKGVSPVYPEIAKQARVEGEVILEVTTDVNGRVENVKVLRSIPLLDQAAIDCVRQWVYEPTIIDGKPRRVIHTVTTTFKLPLSFYLEQAKRSILMGIAELTSGSSIDTTSRLISDAIDHLKSGIEAADDELKVTLKDYTIQLESLKGIKKNYSLAGEMKLQEIVKEIKKLIEETKRQKLLQELELEQLEKLEPEEKLEKAMKDITVISTALTDYVTDNGVAPTQDGQYEADWAFYDALAPFYVKVLPIKDGWGNNYLVYCGKACNGVYGISGCGSDDFIVVSYGRDGQEDDWKFDSSNPEAGLIGMKTEGDFNIDLIMWNGSWIRGPRIKEN